MRFWFWLSSFLFLLALPFLGAFYGDVRCDKANPCPNGFCCSEYGYCGNTHYFCGEGCQRQCYNHIRDAISDDLFEKMLPNRNDSLCEAWTGFYSLNAFVYAAESFEGFGTTGDEVTRKREVAAFLAQTAHETNGWWEGAKGGPYEWGYCYIRERNPPQDYCVDSTTWPCSAGEKYYGRGPIQIKYNTKYGRAGSFLGVDLVSNPDLAATDAKKSFETAIWFWMNSHDPLNGQPSSHDVITGKWVPSGYDLEAGRIPGYGVITNIINGGIECGKGPNAESDNRVGFYKHFCDIMGIGYGDNLDCDNQKPFDEPRLLNSY